MNLRELAGVIERNDRGKQDLEVRSNEIKVSEDGVLLVDGKKLWPNIWAWYLLITRASGGRVTKRYMMNGRKSAVWGRKGAVHLPALVRRRRSGRIISPAGPSA